MDYSKKGDDGPVWIRDRATADSLYQHIGSYGRSILESQANNEYYVKDKHGRFIKSVRPQSKGIANTPAQTTGRGPTSLDSKANVCRTAAHPPRSADEGGMSPKTSSGSKSFGRKKKRSGKAKNSLERGVSENATGTDGSAR